MECVAEQIPEVFQGELESSVTQKRTDTEKNTEILLIFPIHCILSCNQVLKLSLAVFLEPVSSSQAAVHHFQPIFTAYGGSSILAPSIINSTVGTFTINFQQDQGR